MKRLFKQFSFPGGIPSHVAPETPGLDPRRRRAGLRAVARLRRGVRQPRPDRRLRGRRRRGRDRAAGHQLALEQVPQPGARRRGAADPAPERLQDRQPDACWPASATRSWTSSSAATATRRTSSRATIPATMHQLMAAHARRGHRRDPAHPGRRARERRHGSGPRWPMIVLRTPKGWTVPEGGRRQAGRGHWRAHQVPMGDMHDKPEHLQILEAVDEELPAGGAVRRRAAGSIPSWPSCAPAGRRGA